jgi:pimeloyl-ACP methyl ester carboxylesterase
MALSAKQLAFTRVTADGVTPSKWLYVVHGIFGAGRNWTAVAKRVARNRPEWGAMLIDLREHGASQDFPPPHTIDNAANDLAELAASTADAPEAILGHSFGGKVALAFARNALSVKQAWIIDSTPAATQPGGSAFDMLQIVKSVPDSFASREDAVQRLMQLGVAQPTAMWMVTNLQEHGGSYQWRFRKESMQDLLGNFFKTDLWDVVENPRDGLEVHLVKASQSGLLGGAELTRAKNAVDDAHVFMHVVEGGHWLNADNPDAVVDLLTKHLPQ